MIYNTIIRMSSLWGSLYRSLVRYSWNRTKPFFRDTERFYWVCAKAFGKYYYKRYQGSVVVCVFQYLHKESQVNNTSVVFFVRIECDDSPSMIVKMFFSCNDYNIRILILHSAQSNGYCIDF